MRTIRLIAVVLVVAGLAVPVDVGASAAGISRDDSTSDFNGDASEDVAVGIPDKEVGADNAGAVQVLYGDGGVGLTTDGNKVFHQNTKDIKGSAQEDDAFGSAIATGDFDGDGFDDLAVGIPNENVNGVTDAGSVAVLYGSLNGISADGNQRFSQEKADVQGEAAPYDHFGASLTTGDFNGDGFFDLAVGVPDDQVGSYDYAGGVNVLYGSSGGLQVTDPPDQYFSQNAPYVADTAERNDSFARSLTSGNFDNDADDDLVVGVPLEDLDTLADAGAVHVFKGSTNGLSSLGSQFWTQDSDGVDGAAEAYDNFGWSLAAGDFHGTKCDDLAIGAPQDDVGTYTAAGVVNILHGSEPAGLTSDNNEKWDQSSFSYSHPESGNKFGWSLAAGAFIGGDRDDMYDMEDLAVGVPYQDSTLECNQCGIVYIMYSAFGFASTDTDTLYQGKPSFYGGAGKDYEHLGWSLTTASIYQEGDDIIAGIPWDDGAGPDAAGAIQVFYYSTSNGLDDIFTQNTAGVNGTAKADDHFAEALSSS